MPPKGKPMKRAPNLENDSGDELEMAIREHYRDGLPDTEAVKLCQDLYNRDVYHLSVKSYRNLRESLGLMSVRKQGWTVETAAPILAEARLQHPHAGIRKLKHYVSQSSGQQTIKIPRPVVYEWMKQHEPGKLQERKHRVLRRRQYYCAGPNHIWSVDQHDKLKRFGIWLHGGVDVYSGHILWIKAYWTNSNPRLIAKYYLDTIDMVGGMPLVTFSDKGSENFGIANAQSALRQSQDPSLSGTMQHKWHVGHGNIKAEILWSKLRDQWGRDFEEFLEEGIKEGWFDLHVTIEMLTFRFTFMPLVQSELDFHVKSYNTYYRRANTKTILPHGRPKIIYKYPEQYDTRDYKVTVPQAMHDEVRMRFANPQDPVFIWIPPLFEQQATAFHQERLGNPTITRANAWWCYRALLDCFRWLASQNAIPPDLSHESEMQLNLLAQSDLGASRGDAWGYDVEGTLEEYEIEPAGEILEEDEPDAANVNLEVDISGDEDMADDDGANDFW